MRSGRFLTVPDWALGLETGYSLLKSYSIEPQYELYSFSLQQITLSRKEAGQFPGKPAGGPIEQHFASFEPSDHCRAAAN